MNLAPIILFVYARPSHTQSSLSALQANPLAEHSDLFIYSDAAKTPQDEPAVAEVRTLISGIRGFKSATVILRPHNFGLAANIISGVTEICNRHGKAIVLEDDIVVNPFFLSFMNHALDKYAEIKSVWHISAWNYPIPIDTQEDGFFWRGMNCWGWGTWHDRWRHYQKNPGKLQAEWSSAKIKAFNIDGAHDFWFQVQQNQLGKMNTWAIFWYATLFEHNGLCLNPSISFVENIGHDGSGEHCEKQNAYLNPAQAISYRNLPDLVQESEFAVDRIRFFYRTRQTFLSRTKSMIRRLINDIIRNNAT